MKLNDYKSAIGCFKEILKQDAQDSDAWFELGNCLSKTDNCKEAIKCFDRVIRIEPNHAEVYDAKVECLRSLGLNDEADELIAKREMDDW